MSLPDTILTCIASHLGIDNVVSALAVRGKRDSVEEKMGFAVAKWREYEDYWDVMVWRDIAAYQRDSRPACDHRVAVGKDGRLYQKKQGGRKRAMVVKEVVGLRIAVSDIDLVDRASPNRSTYMRRACQRSAYLDHIRSMHDDSGMHTRPVGNGWGLFSSDGSCVASGDDEVAMLRELIPYEDLMAR
jgi:hypothetical protein